MKCAQYWPTMTGQSKQYEKYTVTCEHVTEYADYVVRILILTERVRVIFFITHINA